MNTKIKTILVIFGAILIGFTSCQEDEYALGDLTAPTGLTITADIVGQSEEFPDGDGSGNVNFTFSASNAISYKVDFGDGSAPRVLSSVTSLKYNKVGTKHYRVIVTANGKGGITTTAIKEIDVYYAYNVNPLTVTLLTGDSATGKKWTIDSDVAGNIGNGPGPERPDGNAETFWPSWYSAGPNAKATKGIYDDIYTFTNTKVFTHQTNGNMYGYKTFFIRDFDADAPGAYGGYGDEWILDYPDYTESFDYDGDLTGNDGNPAEYITWEQKGHCGFFNGSHKMMILELTETTMWLRAAETHGTNVGAWYVKLKAI